MVSKPVEKKEGNGIAQAAFAKVKNLFGDVVLVPNEPPSSAAYKPSHKLFRTSTLELQPRILDHFASKGALLDNFRAEL
ncbi:hypothetical protein IFM89_034228 [Coptis chinensis]|uniref:Uncharacterized protein n=1 Tax=Coptis chinensis TaxID=261450 RepID=A0A835H8H2_9MAGN|nr:hypothetical protein IFM89_034228 [Coptis chinensis]